MCIPLSSRLTCSCRQGAGCRRLGVLLQSRAGSSLPCTLIPQRPKGADWVKPMSLVWWAVVSLVSAQRHDSHYKNVRFSHVPGALKHQRLRVSRTQALGGRGGCMEQDLSSSQCSWQMIASAWPPVMHCPGSHIWDRFLQTPCSDGLALIFTQLLTAAGKCKGGAEHSDRCRHAGDILGHNKLSREFFLIWVQTVYANYMAAVLAISIHAFNLHFWLL